MATSVGMIPTTTLPLFVLGPDFMPMSSTTLRVFEPRYRQMLDDCLLDDRNFGLVLNDPLQSVNHWDGPRVHGCEAEIIHHETKGSNHFIQIIGRRRFTVTEIHEPALPPFDHPMLESLVSQYGVDPDLQSMLELIPEDVGHSKLYISAEVEYHDSYLFWQLVKKHSANGMQTTNLSRGHPHRPGVHVFINSPLGEYMDHLTGKRKKDGRSKPTDIYYKRDADYWKKI